MFKYFKWKQFSCLRRKRPFLCDFRNTWTVNRFCSPGRINLSALRSSCKLLLPLSFQAQWVSDRKRHRSSSPRVKPSLQSTKKHLTPRKSEVWQNQNKKMRKKETLKGCSSESEVLSHKKCYSIFHMLLSFLMG